MDVLLVYAQNDSGLQLVDDLKVEGLNQLVDHFWSLASTTQDVGVIEHQLVALTETLLQGF